MSDGSDEEGFGDWYDLKQGDDGDPWHRTLIDPGLFARVGRLPAGIRVLDLACGNGYIARRFAREGARVVGVDASPSLIARARERERAVPLGVTYHLGDAARLTMLGDGSAELVTCNMGLIDIERADAAIAEVARILVPGGRFVFSISHPCFDIDLRSAWVTEKVVGDEPVVFRKVTGYRRPHSDRYPWVLAEGRRAWTVGYHRPLSWYADQLRESGFYLVALDEPAPGPGFVGRAVRKEWIDEIPMHLVVEARTWDRASRSAARRPPSAGTGSAPRRGPSPRALRPRPRRGATPGRRRRRR